MAGKRPLPDFTQNSPPAFSPPATPATPFTPTSLSPVATHHAALHPVPPPKKRKVGRPRKDPSLTLGGKKGGDKDKDREGSVTGGTPAATPGLEGPAAGASGQEAEPEEEEEEEEEEEGGAQKRDDDYSVRKREDQANKEKLRLLLEHFDSQQMERYTEYRSSGLSKANVRRLANAVLQQSVSDKVTIVTRGFAKVFVGEMVERALAVQRRRGGSGPLTTYDLKEAYRSHLAEKDRGGSDRRRMFIR